MPVIVCMLMPISWRAAAMLQLPGRGLAVALGMAKPGPRSSDCDMMNVFTPTTSPRMFTSGRLGLGLMGASVWT